MPATRLLSELLDGQTIGYANGPAFLERSSASLTLFSGDLCPKTPGTNMGGINTFITTGQDICVLDAGSFRLANNNHYLAIGGNTRLYRDEDNIFAQRNGTNAQAFRLYNTYTDAANYERGFMWWDSNLLKIGTEAAGTGTKRQIGGTGTYNTVEINGLQLANNKTFINPFEGHIGMRNTVCILWSASASPANNNNGDVGLCRLSVNRLGVNSGSNALEPTGDIEARDLYLNPSGSLTPANNGQLSIEATNDTTLSFKLKGSDGTVRTGTLTLA